MGIVDPVVKRETKYIALFSSILSILMQIVFLFLKKWDYTVLLGNILSFAVAVLNFFLMGIAVQKAVSQESSDAKKTMKSSHGLRNVGVFAVTAIGVVLPYFNTVAVILPLFFPRIAIMFRPLIKDKKDVSKSE